MWLVLKVFCYNDDMEMSDIEIFDFMVMFEVDIIVVCGGEEWVCLSYFDIMCMFSMGMFF